MHEHSAALLLSDAATYDRPYISSGYEDEGREPKAKRVVFLKEDVPMLNEKRWLVEVTLVREQFPGFRQFIHADGAIGFCGSMRGSCNGQLYEVIVKIPVEQYPQREPAVYIQPSIGKHCDTQGMLSYLRRDGWNPTKNTFANCLLCAFAYLHEEHA